nr:phosphoinositide phosphatase SAC8 isoform X2 [Tanacetum cinerariifolium]
MTMHEVVHEMVVGECHEPNSEGSGSAWKAYMNAMVAGWSCWSTPTRPLRIVKEIHGLNYSYDTDITLNLKRRFKMADV